MLKVLTKQPSKKLSPLIEEFWFTQMNSPDDAPDTDHIIPSGCLNVVFNIADPYYFLKDKETSILLPDIVLTGKFDKVCRIKYRRKLKQIGITLKPGGLLCLFRQDRALYKDQIRSSLLRIPRELR
jgi:hypothetical protein